MVSDVELEEMHMYLEDYFGIPLALRELGTSAAVCPYCGQIHEHGPLSGHQEAMCGDEVRDEIEIYINGRRFVCNYGYSLIEYTVVDGKIGEVIIPPNLE